ncbi:MAG: TlpA disulfide reductase family protein [Gammaproteobacteria bacterium]|nr:TlpA disulfide reductase family protein [Gammaproteobacteria bacterium]
MKTYPSRIIKLVMVVVFSQLLMLQAQAASLDGAAPDFTLKSMSGKNLKLSELSGNVVLLNFWASWCGPCRTEMPLLNDLHNKYEALGFTVLGVNVEQETELAKSFIAKSPVDFPILLDKTNKVSKMYDVIAMPTTVMIDRDGNMRYLHKGYQVGDEKKYKKMVKKLVRE